MTLAEGQQIDFTGGASGLKDKDLMPLIQMKPTSPGPPPPGRGRARPHLHKGEPHAPLVEDQSMHGGRNNNGHITTRHKGGGHKQNYRLIDFKRNKDGIAGQGRAPRIRPEPHRAHRAAAATPTASAATSSRRAA